MSCSELKYNFERVPGQFNVLVCCTGSVASIKISPLVSKIRESFVKCLKDAPGRSLQVRVLTTEHAKHFFNPVDLDAIVYEDQDEWSSWKGRSDPVLHIELRRWADLMLIAPLDANTLAKLASGLCDNLLTCVARAWDFKKPIVFAPAMNTYMWEHPFTEKHLASLRDLGYVEIPCIEKTLVCGDKGKGAMAEVATIAEFVTERLSKGS